MRLTTIILALALAASGCQTTSSGRGSRGGKLAAKRARGPSLEVRSDGTFLVALSEKESNESITTDAKGLSLGELMAKGFWETAEKEARARLKAKPHDPEAQRFLASALVLQNNYNLASFYANRGGDTNDPDLLNLRGIAAYYDTKGSLRGRQKAASLFARAFEQNPTHVASGMNLGYLYLSLGKKTEARSTFQAVQKACGSCQISRHGLATAQARLGQYKEAELTLRQVTARDPNDLDALYFLAGIYFVGLKDLDKAEDTLENLLDRAPTSAIDLRSKAQQMLTDVRKADS